MGCSPVTFVMILLLRRLLPSSLTALMTPTLQYYWWSDLITCTLKNHFITTYYFILMRKWFHLVHFLVIINLQMQHHHQHFVLHRFTLIPFVEMHKKCGSSIYAWAFVICNHKCPFPWFVNPTLFTLLSSYCYHAALSAG